MQPQYSLLCPRPRELEALGGELLLRHRPRVELAGLDATPAAAQYFGQNKVQYRAFDFQILKTDRFDIYYYPEEEAAARDGARMAERWHARLARIFGHQLSTRQPLILYASHPHFEQTNVIEGLLGEPIPLGHLPEDAAAWQVGVDELASEDTEIAEYVHQLEEAKDTAELPEASGEAIAQEFERYLRRRDKGTGA